MRKISNTLLVVETKEDLMKLVANPNNRSSIYDLDSAEKKGYHSFAAIMGRRRVKQWMNYLAINGYSPLAVLPVWDNGDGTYMLGDGHTRTEAYRGLALEGIEFDMPQIPLCIVNDMFPTKEAFIAETPKLNAFSGKKWDIWDKVLNMAQRGNENALKLIEMHDYANFDVLKAMDIKDNCTMPLNIIMNICLDTQGTTKTTNVSYLEERKYTFNPYAKNFILFMNNLKNAIIKQNDDLKGLPIFKEQITTSLYNFFMCAMYLDKENNTTKYSESFQTAMNALFTLKGNDMDNKIHSLKRTTEYNKVFADMLGTFTKSKGKKYEGVIAYTDKIHDLVKVIMDGNGGMKDINKRGGRQCSYNEI